MESRYNEQDAQQAIALWSEVYGEPMALRVYTSRLIGQESTLVLHGGGNTSVKTKCEDVYGDEVAVMGIKGSGWDLAQLEPAGLPLVRLEPMRRLVLRDHLTDEAMVKATRAAMLDPSAPTPSIETLLHAFLPARFVDHSHADAILALTNHPDGAMHVRRALGDDILLVPYVKPGFDLARDAARLFAKHTDARAMVLLQHGLFTWGDTAKESYEEHIALVDAAERYLAGLAANEPKCAPSQEVVAAKARWPMLAPILRGLLGGRVFLDVRQDAQKLGWLRDVRLASWVEAGPLTPDHTIRTKARACLIPVDDFEQISAFSEVAKAQIDAYKTRYDHYVDDQASRAQIQVVRVDPNPRVLCIPGVGLVGVGASPGAAKIAADIAEHTLHTKIIAEGIGTFEPLSDAHLFDVEYWSLEQAKLRAAAAIPAMRGQVAVVVGAAGAMGVGISAALAASGAMVAMIDRDASALQAVHHEVPGALCITGDVTQPAAIQRAMQEVCAAWGGIDVTVIVAGVAEVSPLITQSATGFERLQHVNTTGVLNTMQAAAKVLMPQGLGGHIVLIGSKNVAGPGAAFGAYSASKAAAHQLAKIAAMEWAPYGISVNIVAPDAVFVNARGGNVASGLWTQVGASRAAAKGLDLADLPAHYQDRNLLHAEITGLDVGKAVCFLVSSGLPMTGVILPVDGGVPAAFLR